MQRERKLRHAWKSINGQSLEKKLADTRVGKSTYLSMNRNINTPEYVLPPNLVCFSKNRRINHSFQSPRSGSQQRGHTWGWGGNLAATSNCFLSETKQEVKLHQETLNRAPIVPSSQLRDTMGPFHLEALQAGGTVPHWQLFVGNFHKHRLAQICVN